MLNLQKLNMEMSSVIVFAILGVTNIVGVESIGQLKEHSSPEW